MAGDCRFFEFRLCNDDPRDIVRAALASPGASLVNTLNAHSFNVALTDAAFHDALLASDALVADGIGVVWAAQMKGAKGLRKISGADLFQASMELANEEARMRIDAQKRLPELLAPDPVAMEGVVPAYEGAKNSGQPFGVGGS